MPRVRLLSGFTGIGRRGTVCDVDADTAAKYCKRGTMEPVSEDEPLTPTEEGETETEEGEKPEKPKPKPKK